MTRPTAASPSEAPGVKPLLRGVLHQFAGAAAAGAGVLLVSIAPTSRAAFAAGVFAASLVTLFAVSATYHRVHWSAPARARMRRADHASIFVLIAGTYTPICLLGLTPDLGSRVLAMIWGGALIGIAQSLFWISLPKVIPAVLAVAVGWTIVPFFGEARLALGDTSVLLLAAGGFAYTFGAVAYALKRPNPLPGVFGYHEVFHALTLIGAVTHFVAVTRLVLSA